MTRLADHSEPAEQGTETAVILKGYPRLSETFIAQEIRALEQAGCRLRLISLRRPTDPTVHPIHREIQAPVTYLPEYLYEAPGQVAHAWRAARVLPGYNKARTAWLEDLRRDPTPNRVRRFGQACVLATSLPPTVTRLHVHFLHTPASVARYCALMTSLPWSCSAHAKDIWTTPEWEIREKMAELAWLVTCSAAGRDHLASLAPNPERVHLVYHGLDFARFPPPTSARPPRDGSQANDPVTLLSVGRAVEKKGLDDLLAALGSLPPAQNWRLIHIGGGAKLSNLKSVAERLGLSDRITWLGPQPQDRVLDAYRQADLFVLASRVAADGDRDGLPNVLMEAQSQALACVATAVSAIPELIIDGETGRLVPPQDPPALGQALSDLIADPAGRARLGKAGFERVRAQFGMQAGIESLLALLAPGRQAKAAE